MRTLTILSFLLVSASAFAGSALNCENPATGARFEIVWKDKLGYTYQMNSQLTNSLKAQGSNPVSESGSGNAQWIPEGFSYESGVAKGHSLHFYSRSGGMKLDYINYSDWTRSKPYSSFYFNPGECRFSK